MAGPLDLIGSIYDAAFDAARWPGVMLGLGEAMQSPYVLLRMYDYSSGGMTAVAPGADPDYLRSYRDHWGRIDPLWGRVQNLPAGCVHYHERLVDSDELYRSEFYNEWLRPQACGAAGLGVNLLFDQGVPAAFGVKFARDEELTADRVQLFRLLAPHFVRAAQIHRCLWRNDILEAVAGAGLNARYKGVVLVDARGRVAYANAAAESMFETGDALRLESGVLACADRQASDRLRGLIAGCTDSGVAYDGPGGAVEMRRAAGQPLRVLVAPFRVPEWRDRATWWGLSWPVAILLVSDPDVEIRICRSELQKAFGLTPAEADVAIEIAKGDGRAAAARRLEITPGTVRIQLQNVFDKTGVHRQAELVRLIEDARLGGLRDGNDISDT